MVTVISGDALIVVDMQNDFLSGGSLAIPGEDKIIPLLNRYIFYFQTHELPIIATRDWHPADHYSFQPQGGPWPPHCITGSKGAAFHPDLELPVNIHIISKATSQEKNAYSGFTDTQLNALLQSLNIRRVFICGIATEYCVLNTVKDALQFHYVTFILEDAISAISQQAEDGQHALEEMIRLGAMPTRFKEFTP